LRTINPWSSINVIPHILTGVSNGFQSAFTKGMQTIKDYMTHDEYKYWYKAPVLYEGYPR
jgi:hypothetical protein